MAKLALPGFGGQPDCRRLQFHLGLCQERHTGGIYSSELFDTGEILFGMFGIANTIVGEIAEAV
jgi:hypothetical protein